MFQDIFCILYVEKINLTVKHPRYARKNMVLSRSRHLTNLQRREHETGVEVFGVGCVLAILLSVQIIVHNLDACVKLLILKLVPNAVMVDLIVPKDFPS